jgi:hypothetical protein
MAEPAQAFTEVKSSRAKRESKFKATATVEDKAKSKGAYKLTALEKAGAEWEAWIRGEVTAMTSQEGTVCLMFYPTSSGELLYDDDKSGFPQEIKSNLKALRKVSGVDANKASVCAEEHILVRGDGNKYLFSIAFDRNGVKPACRGCRALLQHYAIKDLGVERK